jgi:hypothetical protein
MENNIAGKQKNRQLFILLFLLAYVLNIRAQNGLDSLDWKIGSNTLRTVSPVMVQSLRIDKALTDNIHKENFKMVPSKVNIYDLPYSMTANYPNYKRLALNTGVLYGAGVLSLGVLYALPEDATAWNKSETINTPPFKRWWRNVKRGPVVDKDNFIFNYVLHPYGGAAYYMGARSQGFNILYSALYATGISTIFWEYGIEAFMEIPSLQDLIITPIAGTLMGEGFYILKRHIVANDYRLFGSPILGNIVAYLIDPVNEVIGIFAGNPSRTNRRSADSTLAYTPWISASDNGRVFGFTISFSF